MGHGNPKYDYYFGQTLIPTVNTIRDLGVQVSNNLKFHEHINQIVKSATVTANQIHRCFTLKNKKFLAKMFKVFVRNPVYKGDIECLEGVQRLYKTDSGFTELYV